MMRRTPFLIPVLIIATIMAAGCIVPERQPISSLSPESTPGSVMTMTTTSVPSVKDTEFLTPVPFYGSPTGTPQQSGATPLVASLPPVNYTEIYHATRSFPQDNVAYEFRLNMPPLLIELDFSPKMTSNKLAYWNSTLDKKFEEKTVTVPSPSASFEMKVYDTATGRVILDEGYGGIRGYSLSQDLQIREPGLYHFEFSGTDMNATIVMKIRE
jgi:hypothetical protein